MDRMHRKGGFTLIELLVVIAIIGILAGILLATVFTVMDRARRAAAGHDIKNFENALNQYYERYHTLPEDPWANYAANAPTGHAADVGSTVSVMYRLLGNGDPSKAQMDVPIQRLRSVANPSSTNVKAETDVTLLDPWQLTPYLYVRGVTALSHPWRSQWPGNREKRCNIWCAASDGYCNSCAETTSGNFSAMTHADAPLVPGSSHIGGDLRAGDDVNNWGGTK